MRTVLGTSMTRMESARRLGRHEQATGPLDLWAALVAGRFSLVPQTKNGTRSYLVLENTPRSEHIRALTGREVEVLTAAIDARSIERVDAQLATQDGIELRDDAAASRRSDAGREPADRWPRRLDDDPPRIYEASTVWYLVRQ